VFDQEYVLVHVAMPDGSDGLLGARHRLPRGTDATQVVRALTHLGSIALENARMHRVQQESISRLEDLNVESRKEFTQLQDILSIHEELRLAAMEGGGLSSVLATLQEYVDGDFAIVDDTDTVLAATDRGGEVAWRPDPVPAGKAPGRTFEVAPLEDGVSVAAPVVLHGELLAWVIGHLKEIPGEIDRAAIEHCAVLTALELLRRKSELEIEVRLKGGLLEALFGGEFDADQIVRQGLILGFDLRETSRVFVIEMSSSSDVESSAEIADHGSVDQMYAAVSGALRDWPWPTLTATRGSSVVVLTNEPAEQKASGSADTPEEVLLEKATKAFQGAPMVLGAGTECRTLDSYRRSYRSAKRGVELLGLMGDANTVFSFRNQSIEAMLLESTDPAAAQQFVERYLEPLVAYDANHSSELLHTLEAYFARRGNLEGTARDLHVHVSTLRYRLNKASELMGIDLRDSNEALAANLAVRLSKILTARFK